MQNTQTKSLWKHESASAINVYQENTSCRTFKQPKPFISSDSLIKLWRFSRYKPANMCGHKNNTDVCPKAFEVLKSELESDRKGPHHTLYFLMRLLLGAEKIVYFVLCFFRAAVEAANIRRRREGSQAECDCWALFGRARTLSVMPGQWRWVPRNLLSRQIIFFATESLAALLGLLGQLFQISVGQYNSASIC